MKSVLCFCALILAGMGAVADPASAQPAFAYIGNLTCLASVGGFASGTTWTITIAGAGNSTATNGSTSLVTEYDQYVIADNPVVGPSYGSAVTKIESTLTGPNADGSFTLVPTKWGGEYTSGPLSGLTYTATTAGLRERLWMGQAGISSFAGEGAPVVQTITLSNGVSYQQVCVGTVVNMAGVQ